MVPNGIIKTDAETVNLSKAYMVFNDFRGLNNLQLQALMLKTASDLYEASLAEAGSSFLIPFDPIGDIALAITQADSQNNEYVMLPRPSLLYILEYSRIYKVGDPTGPYACMEWPGIQISQALLTMLDDIPLLCPFSQEEGYAYTSNIKFYDRNLVGKELDFDSNPEQKEPFMRYAVSFQPHNRTEDLSRLSLPSLSDISQDIALEMSQLHRYHTPARKALDKLLRSKDSYHDWIPEQGPELLYDTRLNRHLGDNGIISPGRV
jgi:hypothetical protein